MTLDGRDLVAGLGLAAFMLILLLAAGSGAVDILRPTPEPTTLLGLPGLFAAPFAGFATTGGG